MMSIFSHFANSFELSMNLWHSYRIFSFLFNIAMIVVDTVVFVVVGVVVVTAHCHVVWFVRASIVTTRLYD
jgi:hypothetical protein